MTLSVVVMAATFRRPVWLAQLLDSLTPEVEAWRAAGGEARIVVVDNDPAGSARETVAGYEGVVYAVESEPGISAARNRCLSEALVFEPDLLAFVDDDETIQPGWLAAHVETLEKHRADASFGPALPNYDPDVARWISRMGFFEPARYATGGQVWFPATNNTVFKVGLLDALGGAFFDPAYGLTGGGDFEFFKRARLKSEATYVWCDEAITREHIPRSRANARWLWRRWRRIGYGWYHKEKHNMVPVLFRAAVNILAAPVLAAYRALPGTHPGKTPGKALLHVALGFGAIEGCLGRPRIVEYARSAPEDSP